MIDLCLDTYDVVIEDDISCIMQQIDILFNTSHYEVLGEYGFGTDLEKFVHNLQVSNYEIKTYVEMLIYNNVEMFGHTLDVNVYIAQGTENDIIFVDVSVSDGNKEYSKQYRID